MGRNVIFRILRRIESDDSPDGFAWTMHGELPPIYVKTVSDEFRSKKVSSPYFPKPFSIKLGDEGRSVQLVGNFGDSSYPGNGGIFDVSNILIAGMFLEVVDNTTEYKELPIRTRWLLDGLSTEREGKSFGFLTVNMSLFGFKNGSSWIW